MKEYNYISCNDAGCIDFYGPLCVVACYIDPKDIHWLKELNLDHVDLQDVDQIIKYGQLLKEHLIYSLLIMDNSHYNQMIDEGNKMSQIKTILYNQAMINVIKRVKKPVDKKIVIPFLTPKKYYKNLKNKTLVVTHLIFSQNEQHYIGLTCAKILAQYAHYQYFRNMQQTLQITIPHGCNMAAIQTGIQLVRKHGTKILENVSKKNLPNYNQILEHLKASD